jgi:hypothetical protein
MSLRGGPFTSDAVNRLIKRIGVRAGFDFQVHCHMLRHAWRNTPVVDFGIFAVAAGSVSSGNSRHSNSYACKRGEWYGGRHLHRTGVSAVGQFGLARNRCRTPFHPQRHRTAPLGQPVLLSATVCALGPPSLRPKFFRHVEAVRNWTVSWQTHEQISSDHRDGNAALFYMRAKQRWRRYNRARAAFISARPRRDRPNKRKPLVIFIFVRAFVGLLHDIAPSAQGFSDAGKPRFFGGRKTVHVVTDFVEHIDDAVDPLERLRDFYRRRHFFKLPF